MGLIQIISVAILVSCVDAGAPPSSPLTMTPFPPFFKTCAEDNGLDFHEIEKDPSTLPEVTPEFLCFLKCIHEKLEVIDENGELDRDKMKPLIADLPEGKIEKFEECAFKTTKIEKCEDMAGLVECIAAVRSGTL